MKVDMVYHNALLYVYVYEREASTVDGASGVQGANMIFTVCMKQRIWMFPKKRAPNL